MPQRAIETEDLDLELIVPRAPEGVIIVIDGDWRDSARRRASALGNCLSTRRYAVCVLEPAPRRWPALVSSDETDEMNLITERLAAATHAIRQSHDLKDLPIGHVACGIGSAASMVVAAADSSLVHAIVTTDGRPDLAGVRLHRFKAASLFIVTRDDRDLYEMNRWAQRRLSCPTRLDIIERRYQDIPIGIDIDDIAKHSIRWFDTHMARGTRTVPVRSVKQTTLFVDQMGSA
ncbi:MAG: hypothetical protein ABI556_16855 [Gemmatimonadales bacterium]